MRQMQIAREPRLKRRRIKLPSKSARPTKEISTYDWQMNWIIICYSGSREIFRARSLGLTLHYDLSTFFFPFHMGFRGLEGIKKFLMLDFDSNVIFRQEMFIRIRLDVTSRLDCFKQKSLFIPTEE